MIICSLAFLSGNVYLQTFSHLPTTYIVCAALVGSFFFSFYLKNRTKLHEFPVAFILGFTWSWYCASSILSWSLPGSMEGKPIQVKGYISSLPDSDTFGTRFEFNVLEMKYLNHTEKRQFLMRLSWRKNVPHLQVGDKWQFLVRMKRIHGLESPGAFDFEAWALQKSIRATGYIINSAENKWLSHHWYDYPVNQIRQALQERIRVLSSEKTISPWLPALITGERNGVPPGDWQILRSTGTNHLMAIAGLHIGIAVAFVHLLTSWVWRRFSRLPLLIPAQHAAAGMSLVTAISYSSLAGFSIPTQRACLMLLAYMLTILGRHKSNAWNAWALALFLVQMLNPLSILTESFWLSFGTIALIIYGMSGRLAPRGIWWKWGRVQWVIGVGLIPMTLAFFQECSLISFLANSIAIPWLGFFILPFCLLGAFFIFIIPAVGFDFLLAANKSLEYLWLFLSWMAKLNFSAVHVAIPNNWILVMFLSGMVILLLPAGMPGRWLGIAWLMPALLCKPDKPSSGDFWLTVLDVGQGLSAVIQTNHHLIVYDAGPRLNASLDMGENVVIPYLRRLAAPKVDMLVISHGDNDHIGGAASILKSFEVNDVQSSVPNEIHAPNRHYCRAGYSWEWDGVRFAFLYPSDNDMNYGNDSSCVLRIENGDHRILLTGDIEKYAENELLARVPEKLSAEVIVAPHHGSKTSGMRQFIEAVHPQSVIYATGYRNRYHFPHPSVVDAYESMRVNQFNTVASGTIQFKLEKGKWMSLPNQYRSNHHRYWYD